jgi:hypothetical protein
MLQYKIFWCLIIVLNVHAPTEDENDDVKDGFYDELECVFDKFSKYHVKILLGDFKAKVGIHKYPWTSPARKIHNQIDHFLVDRRRHSSVLDVRWFKASDCDTNHYLVS